MARLNAARLSSMTHMMNKMVVANLVHRPTRSFIATSAIALEVTMILMVVALFYGLLNGSKESQLGVGADLMVMPPGSSGLIGMSGAPISVKVGDMLRKVPHVVSAVPVIWRFTQKPVEIIYGIDLKSYDALPPKFIYLSGGPFQGPYDVIVDDYFAGMNHSKVGDKIEILNHDFRICGIVPHGKGGRKFLPLSTMQDLVGAEGRLRFFISSWIIPRIRTRWRSRSSRFRAWRSTRCARCRNFFR